MRLAICLLLSGCSVALPAPPVPLPPEVLSHRSTHEGSGVVGPLFAFGRSVLPGFRYRGGPVTITATWPGSIVVDGDIVIEPLDAAAMNQAMADGRVRLGSGVAVGTILPTGEQDSGE